MMTFKACLDDTAHAYKALTRTVVASALAFGLGMLSTPTNAVTFGPSADTPHQAEAENTDHIVYDPFEDLNREIFGVNMAVDDAVIRPASQAYGTLPNMAREGVYNLLNHLRTPVVFVNTVLQGDLKGAGITAVRFWLNTIGGVGGVHDFATERGLKKYEEDFGQTLAVWGLGDGPYIVIPLLGPSNARDVTGRVVDYAFDPLTWVGGSSIDAIRAGQTTLTVLDTRHRLDPIIRTIEARGLDNYASFRTSYTQRRNDLISNSTYDVQSLPDFDYDLQ